MYNQLTEMLNQLFVDEFGNEIDIAKTPNYRVMVALRDELEALLQPVCMSTKHQRNLANEIVSRMTIEISVELTDEQVSGLVRPFASIIVKFFQTMESDGFTDEQIVRMCTRMNLKLG